MRITLLPQHKEIVLPGRHRVADVLRQLNLIPGTVMVIRKDALVTERDFLDPDDSVEIRSVISGGL